MFEKAPDQVRINSQSKLLMKMPNVIFKSLSQLALKQDGFSEHPLYTCLVAEGKENVYDELNRIATFLSDTSTSPARVVAIALMFNVYSTWEGKCLHLEDLYVQVDYRKRGIGKALFAATYQVDVPALISIRIGYFLSRRSLLKRIVLV